MNAFEQLGFVLIAKEDGTYIKLEDVKVDNDVVDNYISLVGVRNFDRASLHLAIAKKTQTTIRFSRDIIDEFNELMKLDISPSKTLAKVTFYPPTESGKFLTEKDIREQLKNFDIIYGLKEDTIKEICEKHEYFKEYLVAEGEEPIQGKSAYIEYKFDIYASNGRGPKLRADGTVDYNSVEIVNPVSEGELLAVRIPPVPGQAGKSVSGEDIYPDDLLEVKIGVGNNVVLSETEDEIYSKCDGQAAFRSGKVTVDNVYIVQGDVDVTTGNVAFNGDIVVNGNVRTGFTVRAKGNIEINGVVEAAKIEAGKNVLIRDGVQGNKRAYIIAGGDVTAKFIESATVFAEGFIEANSILYSDITSEKSVTVKGKKAIIVGGTVRSLGQIECDKAGSIMGATTILQVGYPDNIEELKFELVDNISETEKKKDELLQVVKYYKKLREKEEITPETEQIISNVVNKTKDIINEIDQMRRSFERLKRIENRKELETDMIEVSSYAYQGVKIEINGASLRIRDGIAKGIYTKESEHLIKVCSR